MAKNQTQKKQPLSTKPAGTDKPGTPAEPLKWYTDPRYKSLLNTIIFIIIALIFFIVNNTRKEPDHGPYPPTTAVDSTGTLIR